MKIFKVLGSLSLSLILLFSIGSEFSSCTKTTIIHDTVTQVIRDTVNVVHDTSHNCNNINDGLVAFYPFTNGSLKDSSGNNNDIYFNNATVTTDRFGNANNAYLFNGTSSYMKVKNSTSLNPSTISLVAIVKPTSFNTASCESNQILGKGWNDYVNGFYFIRFQDLAADCNASTPAPTNNVRFMGGYGNMGTGSIADTGRVQLNQWYTVVYTYDGYESRLYVNGKLEDITVVRNAFTPNSLDLSIGSHEDPQFRYFFSGLIDEVRIYNKALCMDQVKAISELKR
jgi:hypothetical protein